MSLRLDRSIYLALALLLGDCNGAVAHSDPVPHCEMTLRCTDYSCVERADLGFARTAVVENVPPNAAVIWKIFDSLAARGERPEEPVSVQSPSCLHSSCAVDYTLFAPGVYTVQATVVMPGGHTCVRECDEVIDEFRLVIDSDNNNEWDLPDDSQEEFLVREDPELGKFGKLIQSSDTDQDGDGVRDWWDGLWWDNWDEPMGLGIYPNAPGVDAEANQSRAKLTPLRVFFKPARGPLSSYRLNFEYGESPAPSTAELSTVGDWFKGLPSRFPYPYSRMHDLRLWRRGLAGELRGVFPIASDYVPDRQRDDFVESSYTKRYRFEQFKLVGDYLDLAVEASREYSQQRIFAGVDYFNADRNEWESSFCQSRVNVSTVRLAYGNPRLPPWPNLYADYPRWQLGFDQLDRQLYTGSGRWSFAHVDRSKYLYTGPAASPDLRGAVTDGASVVAVRALLGTWGHDPSSPLYDQFTLSIEKELPDGTLDGRTTNTKVFGGLYPAVAVTEGSEVLDLYPPIPFPFPGKTTGPTRRQRVSFDPLGAFTNKLPLVNPESGLDGIGRTPWVWYLPPPQLLTAPATDGEGTLMNAYAPPPTPGLVEQDEMRQIRFVVRLKGRVVGAFPFLLRRPPVLLVHGYQGSGKDSFPPQYWNEREIPTRVYRADYASSNHLGYAENQAPLFRAIRRIINEYQAGEMGEDGVSPAYLQTYPYEEHSLQVGGLQSGGPARPFRGMGFATTRIDVVGHSMGGQIVRLYMSNLGAENNSLPNPITIDRPGWPSVTIDRRSDWMDPDTENQPYQRSWNHGAGDFRIFIPIGSPFKGSPMGNAVQEILTHWNETLVSPPAERSVGAGKTASQQDREMIQFLKSQASLLDALSHNSFRFWAADLAAYYGTNVTMPELQGVLLGFSAALQNGEDPPPDQVAAFERLSESLLEWQDAGRINLAKAWTDEAGAYRKATAIADLRIGSELFKAMEGKTSSGAYVSRFPEFYRGIPWCPIVGILGDNPVVDLIPDPLGLVERYYETNGKVIRWPNLPDGQSARALLGSKYSDLVVPAYSQRNANRGNPDAGWTKGTGANSTFGVELLKKTHTPVEFPVFPTGVDAELYSEQVVDQVVRMITDVRGALPGYPRFRTEGLGAAP